MNIASKNRLSLRKLFTALLAVGPLAVLPSPVWAVLPTSTSFTTTSGTVALSTSGQTVNISFSDKAILTWGTTGGATNFNVGATETWNFASSGAILNKVSKGSGVNAAEISGSLLGTSARVFIVADGNIVINGGAQLNTQSLVLSTVPELADAVFQSLGDLQYGGGAATGSITFGGAVSVGGHLSATAATIATTGASITAAGDVVLNSLTSGAGLDLPTSTVNGNLSVMTNNGAITQSGVISVGAVSGTQTATLKAGTADITLADNNNNFDRVAVSGNNVSLRDANIVTVGASSVGGNLTMKVGGLPSVTGIATDGTLSVVGNVSLDSSSSGVSGISVANDSVIGGVLSAKTSGGNINVSVSGNLTLGNITNNATATTMAGASYTTPTATAAIAGGVITIASSNFGAGNPAAPIAGASGPTITFASPTASASFNATQNTNLFLGNATVTPAGTFGAGQVVTLASANATSPGNQGSGYNPAAKPTITILGGGGSGATVDPADIVMNGDSIVSFTVKGGSGYTSAPTIVISDPKDATAVRATGIAQVNSEGRMTGITITNNGSGYGSAPLVVITGNSQGASVNVTATGTILTQAAGSASSVSGISSDRAVTLRGTAIENQAKVVISNSQFVATLNATGGNILVNQTITAGRVSLVSATGDIAQTAAGVITTNNTSASSFSAAGNVTLDVAANAFVAGNATAGSFNVSAANASLRSTNNFTLGTANVTGNLSLSAGSDKNIQLGVGSGSSATSVNVGGILAASTAGAGAITDNNDSSFNVAGGLALSAVNGDIVLDAATFPGAFNPSVRFGSVSASTAGNVTLSETTTLNLGNITAANLTAASTQGSIIDTGSLVVSNTANFTVSGNNNVVLDTFAAATLATPLIESRIAKLELNGGVDNSVTNLNAAVAVNSIKGASGTTTVTTASGNGTANAAITLGNVETGNLSLGAGGFIEIAGFSKISGNLSLSAAGVVNNVSTLASWTAPTATVAGNATSSSGRLSGMAASDTVGMLTFAVAPAVTVIGNGVGGVAPAVAATVEPTLNSLGQITGFNVTNNLAHSNYAFGVNPTLAFTGATNTSVLQSVNGALKVAGTTTLATAGNAVLYRNNDFNNVVLASPTGGAIINDINSVSVSGTAGGTVSVTAGANGTVSSTAPANIGSQLAEAGAWGVTLGNVSAGSLQVAANNGGAGNSGRIVQSTGSSISSFGTAAFTTSNNSITVTNAGNSFGRVQLTSGGGAISLTEDGTIKLGNLSSTNGTVTLTSRTGSIIEDSTGTALSAGANGTISLVAANGSILLGNATGLTTGGFGGNTTALGARINASAPSGSVALSSNGTNHLNLGAIEANTLRASAGGNLTQVAAAKVFGSTNLSSVSGDIAITNNGNNFGRVSVTGNANISIVEAATLNLGTVTMPGSGAGSFSATSVNGDIIDSGLSNVRLGGLVGAAGSGVVSLTATNGNIALDDPTTEFPTVAGVVFNAKNVTLAPLGLATIVLGATGQTAMASNLTVTSALGSISNSGAVKVTGDAAFQTSTGDITLVNTGNAFGTVRFAGGLVSITEADDVVLATGSSASKAAVFNALNGSISVANRGGTINLSKTSFFTASGNITLPKLITAGEQITLAAPGTMDLGALSQAGDLNGIAPIFIGVGAQVKPSP